MNKLDIPATEYAHLIGTEATKVIVEMYRQEDDTFAPKVVRQSVIVKDVRLLGKSQTPWAVVYPANPAEHHIGITSLLAVESILDPEAAEARLLATAVSA